MKSASAIAIHQCVVEATLFEETPMTATDSHFAPMAPGAQPPAAAGFATGAVRATLRLEGAMAFACALALMLAPDCPGRSSLSRFCPRIL